MLIILLTFCREPAFLAHHPVCFEALVALVAIRPDHVVVEDTDLVHLSATVDALHHSVGVGGDDVRLCRTGFPSLTNMGKKTAPKRPQNMHSHGGCPQTSPPLHSPLIINNIR